LMCTFFRIGGMVVCGIVLTLGVLLVWPRNSQWISREVVPGWKWRRYQEMAKWTMQDDWGGWKRYTNQLP
jgi:hypothetical protein